MSDQFIGEIRAFGYYFAPLDWAYCSGQEMLINQNGALYAIIGQYYGPTTNQAQTFKLPDLNGRAVIGVGQAPGLHNYTLAQVSGTITVSINSSQLPVHTHQAQSQPPVAGTTLTDTPSAASFPSIPRITSGVATTIYDQWTSGTSNTTLYPLALAPAGGMPNSGVAAAHSNISPFLTMNFCIALQGEWPSRN